MAQQDLLGIFKQRIQNELSEAKKAVAKHASKQEKADFEQVYWRLRFALGYVPPKNDFPEIEVVNDPKTNLPVVLDEI
jgi:hypothetical protein